MRKVTLIGWVLLLIGVVGSLTAYLVPYDIWRRVTTNLASVFIGAGLVQLIFQFFALRDMIEKMSSSLSHKLGLPLEVFYQNRNELPTFEEELSGVSEAWLAWHSGSARSALGFNAIPTGEKKLLLTHPESPALEEISKVSIVSVEKLQKDIKEVTKQALQNGVEVRWFKGTIGNSLILANPSSEEGWARQEVLVPKMDTEIRPSYKVSKKHSKTFSDLKESFLRMWSEAIEPPDEFNYTNIV